jgi:hypothetical protein
MQRIEKETDAEYIPNQKVESFFLCHQSFRMISQFLFPESYYNEYRNRNKSHRT